MLFDGVFLSPCPGNAEIANITKIIGLEQVCPILRDSNAACSSIGGGMPWWSFPNKGPKKSTSLRIPCDTAPSWHLARFSGCVSCDEDLSTFVTQPSCRSWQTKIMMVHTSRASFWTLFNTGLRLSLTFTTFLKRRVESFKVAVLVQVTRLHDRVRDTDCQDLSSIYLNLFSDFVTHPAHRNPFDLGY